MGVRNYLQIEIKEKYACQSFKGNNSYSNISNNKSLAIRWKYNKNQVLSTFLLKFMQHPHIYCKIIFIHQEQRPEV